MKPIKFHTVSAALTASALLVACGGGDTTIEASQKTSETTQASPDMTKANPADSTEGSIVHSNDAHIFTASSSTESSEQGEAIVKSVAVSVASDSAEVKTIDLGAPPSEELAKRLSNNQERSTTLIRKAYQTGIGRTIAETSFTKDFQQVLAWSQLSNGNMAGTARFSSDGAYGLRLGILVTSLPEGALVRVSAPDATTALEITGAAINQAIAANVAADGDSADARTYWLPMSTGSTAELTIELPTGLTSDSVSLSVPSLVHMLESAAQASLAQTINKASCAPSPDPVCSTVPPVANAVSAYDFVESGGSYSCTGTLLADKAASNQPYFLTAEHCVNSQTVASTLENAWFYRSASCATSGTANYPLTKTLGGATLLWHRSQVTSSASNPVGTDTSFLKLNATPPSGVMFSGWKSARQAISGSTALTALHHPEAGVLRQSTGTISGMARATASWLYPSVDVTQPLYEVTWSSGYTEVGSSGSGLFHNGTTSNPQLVGQLLGGYSSCTEPTEPDYYGRFDLAYQDGLINWLNPGYKMVFRFFNTRNGAHFFSSTVSERDEVRLYNPGLTYEGTVYSVASSSGTGLKPVYRFYNLVTGVHFYTITASEAATVRAQPGTYRDEGIAWYARERTNPSATSIPVYRFFRPSVGTHFYTVSTAERDSIIQNLSGVYNYEGVAYQAWAAN